ncbi:hypothetical protein MMC30_003250 [Trapelia coarctata]|nr:hypothetical protein [Trapelia coarctata]
MSQHDLDTLSSPSAIDYLTNPTDFSLDSPPPTPLPLEQNPGIKSHASRCPNCGATFPTGQNCPNGCAIPGRQPGKTSMPVEIYYSITSLSKTPLLQQEDEGIKACASRCPNCGATFPTGQNCPRGCPIGGRRSGISTVFVRGFGMCDDL